MGLEKGLHLSDSEFYNVTMVFCKMVECRLIRLRTANCILDAGYLVCILPGNLLLRKIGPKIQLGSAVVGFGVFVCCYCAARDYGDLIGLRFLVGAAEALIQSSPLYAVTWYGRHELGKRIGQFDLPRY